MFTVVSLARAAFLRESVNYCARHLHPCFIRGGGRNVRAAGVTTPPMWMLLPPPRAVSPATGALLLAKGRPVPLRSKYYRGVLGVGRLGRGQRAIGRSETQRERQRFLALR